MAKFEIGKVPYFDIKDTIEEVGITRRQLSYWESEGLIEAELGRDSKKYTTKDIIRLKALRRLIVDRNLPFPLVKEIAQGDLSQAVELSQLLVRTSALFDDGAPDLNDHVLNLERGELESKADAAEDWWNLHFATASDQTLTRKVYELCLLLFRTVKVQSSRPAAFQQHTSEIVTHISYLVESARIEVASWGDGPDDIYVELDPRYPDDPPFDLDDLDSNFIRIAETIDRYRKALDDSGIDRMRNIALWRRTWDGKALTNLAKVKSTYYSGDMEDVPF